MGDLALQALGQLGRGADSSLESLDACGPLAKLPRQSGKLPGPVVMMLTRGDLAQDVFELRGDGLGVVVDDVTEAEDGCDREGGHAEARKRLADVTASI